MQRKCTGIDPVFYDLEASSELSRSGSHLGGAKFYVGSTAVEGVKNHIWITRLPIQGDLEHEDLASLEHRLIEKGLIRCLTVPTNTQVQGLLPSDAICLPAKNESVAT